MGVTLTTGEKSNAFGLYQSYLDVLKPIEYETEKHNFEEQISILKQ